jgi:hypothetical protein
MLIGNHSGFQGHIVGIEGDREWFARDVLHVHTNPEWTQLIDTWPQFTSMLWLTKVKDKVEA